MFASYAAASASDLISAINAANQSGGSDTITLAAGNTFSLTSVNNNNWPDGPNGLPTIESGGGNLTILGNGAAIERSLAAGTPGFRLFDVAAGASLTLENVTLQGGLCFAYPARGGAIYNQGSLTLDGVTVQNNAVRGAPGGAAFNTNYPGGDASGGGLYSTGVLTMEGCTIQNNLAVGGSGADAFSYFPYIGEPHNVQIHKRRAAASAGGNGFGGGLYVGGGIASIRGSMLTSNTAQGGVGGQGGGNRGQGIGGGIYIDATTASVGLNASTTFRRNSATTSATDVFGSYAVIF